MNISNSEIDGGKSFDFGKTSDDYAKFRDIYPSVFYEKIADRGLCVKGQKVLDLGTGTGVLPRNMYKYGAEWTGIDISAEQISQAKRLAEKENKNISFAAVSAEDADFPAGTFDVLTACQCFWYFDHKKTMPKLAEMLKPHGKLLLLYMEWLPFEDNVAGESENLVLKYNPGWSGAGETRKPAYVPDEAFEYFRLADHEEYDVNVHFTRESWHGRMKACRGTGASMTPAVLAQWEREHIALLERIAPAEFDVLHYASFAVLEKI